MNILVVLENYHPNIGGVETLFKSVCEGLVGLGHEVRVVTSGREDSDTFECVNGVDIQRVTIHSRYLFTLFSLVPLWRLSAQYDLILTTSYNAALPAWIVAFLHRKKVLVVFHEVWGRLWFRLPFFSRIQKVGHYLFEQLLIHLPFDRFIAVSHATEGQLVRHGVPESKVSMIYNGIDYTALNTYKPEPPACFTYCYFGRLGISKGLDILLEASALFMKRYPESRLKLIIPTEPTDLYDRIQEMVVQFDLDDHIRMHHNLSKDDLYKEVASSHCVVAPSYSEGFCFSAVEAMGLGVPVISSGRGALKEVISGKHILLPALTSDGLYDALEKAQAGQWAQTPDRRFDINDTVDAYHALIQELG
jgi:glycosyltransferase involved in cell wall biosynthesis